MTASRKRLRAERWGRRAETLAAVRLRLTGWRILDQRARTGAGELDIVARRGSVLAFVEVKARGDLATALATVTAYQRQRLLRAMALAAQTRGGVHSGGRIKPGSAVAPARDPER